MAMNPAIWRCRKGASLVEYGILVGLIAVLSIGAVLALGERTQTTFNVVTANLGWQIDGVTTDYPARYRFASVQSPYNPDVIGVDLDGISNPSGDTGYGSIAEASFDDLNLRTIQYDRSSQMLDVYFSNNTTTLTPGHQMACLDLSTGEAVTVMDFDATGGFYVSAISSTAYQASGVSSAPFVLGQELACVIEKK